MLQFLSFTRLIHSLFIPTSLAGLEHHALSAAVRNEAGSGVLCLQLLSTTSLIWK